MIEFKEHLKQSPLGIELIKELFDGPKSEPEVSACFLVVVRSFTFRAPADLVGNPDKLSTISVL